MYDLEFHSGTAISSPMRNGHSRDPNPDTRNSESNLQLNLGRCRRALKADVSGIHFRDS